MKTITIKGKQYPMQMSMGTMRRFKRNTGKEVDQISTMDDTIDLVHAAIESACNYEGVEFNLTADDLADAMTVEQFAEISASLMPQSDQHTAEQSAKKK